MVPTRSLSVVCGIFVCVGFALCPTLRAQPVADAGTASAPLTISPAARSISDASVAVSRVTTPTVVSVSVSISDINDKRLKYLEEYLKPFGRRFKADKYRSRGIGSGVIISGDGYIITNNHVVDDSNEDSILVTMHDGQTYLADLVGKDPHSDIALLKIYGSGFAAATFGNSDNVQVGEFVVAVGNPFGLRSTVTSGIVSALGRGELDAGDDASDIKDFIQTDAAINPGNSGGGLFDLGGRLIGINSMIYTSTGFNAGYGFAIPANLAKAVATDLMDDGRLERGYLGVAIGDVTAKTAAELRLQEIRGVVIEDVDKGSPAEKGGLRKSDVIVAIDDEPVKNANELQNRTAQRRAGAVVRFKVSRGDSDTTLSIVLAKSVDPTSPKEEPREIPKGSIGITGGEVDAPAARAAGLDGPQGVLVKELVLYGAAEKAGMRVNDILLEIDGIPVNRPDEVKKMMEGKRAGDKVVATIMQGGKKLNKDIILHSAR